MCACRPTRTSTRRRHTRRTRTGAGDGPGGARIHAGLHVLVRVHALVGLQRARVLGLHVHVVAVLLLLVLSFLQEEQLPAAQALHAEDVGKHDFIVSTAGHGNSGGCAAAFGTAGGNRHVPAIGAASLSSSGEAVLTTAVSACRCCTYTHTHGAAANSATSDAYILGPYMSPSSSSSSSSGSACHLSSRSVETGQLLWRRNACSSSSPSSLSSSLYASSFSPKAGIVHTLDGSGTLRGWDDVTGSLIFDVQAASGDDAETTIEVDGRLEKEARPPRLFGTSDGIGVVGAVWPALPSTGSADDGGDGEILTLFDARTGESKTIAGGIASGTSQRHLSAKQLLSGAKVKKAGGDGQKARVLGMTTNGSILVGYATASAADAANADHHHHHDAKEWVLNPAQGLAICTLKTETIQTTTSEGGAIESTISITNPVPIRVDFGTSRGGGGGGSKSASPSILYRTVQVSAIDSGDGSEMVVLTGISPDGSAAVTLSIDVQTGAASGAEVAMSTLHPHWTAIHSVHQPTFDSDVDGGHGYIAISGTDSRYPQTRLTTALFWYGADGRIGEQIYSGPTVRQDEETEYDATVYCSGNQIVLEREGDAGPVRIKAFEVDTFSPFEDEGHGMLKSQLKVVGDAVLPTEEAVVKADLLSCSAGGPDGGSINMQILVQTAGKMTALIRAKSPGGGKVAVEVMWTAEEALAEVTDSFFLDETTDASSPTDEDEEEALLQRLSLSSRLSSQIRSLTGFISGDFLSDAKSIFLSASGLEAADADGQRNEERSFGFAKVAVLVSRAVAVFGMDVSTATSVSRGSILWKVTLPPHAAWSKIIHGGQTGKSLSGGGQDKHAIHSHEITVVSFVPSVTGENGRARGPSIVWKTLDGLTGKVYGEGSVDAISPVVQIAPIYVAHHDMLSADSFRHAAVILHADESTTVIPDSPSGRAAVVSAINRGSGRNGLFTHTINRKSGSIQTYRLLVRSQEIIAQQVGGSTFIPEQETIVSVAYPRRNEIVQSPARILGDDSLLLSYLNPHVSVVVTAATGIGSAQAADDINGDAVARALSNNSSSSQKAKPLGATKPGEESPATPSSSSATSSPNLFINLVDTISGRILHRAAHSDAASTNVPVPVLISENWIIYAFSNLKSRRTEVGVMSLHEGMIDKLGITAFSSPEQELAFSSFTSPKPIVLAKTYAMATPVTALGVTTTKEGISSKQILMASGEGGQIVSIDRRMLDPRRPTGQIKESEKKEGLHQYHPLIPVSTLRIPSYSQRVESATSIASTAANVESQSLVLAHGGPDLFFTRLSPSRGFDLLPDSFNRALLSIVVVGLCLLVGSVKKMSTTKMTRVSWA